MFSELDKQKKSCSISRHFEEHLLGLGVINQILFSIVILASNDNEKKGNQDKMIIVPHFVWYVVL